MWEIKGKDNQTKAIPSTKPEYNGEWMGESYVTVSVESPAPVNFEIGDYIIYRDERFEINYDPGKIKSAPRYEKGDAFKYENIKFNSLADELTRCDFLDVVLDDNKLHFTGLPKFSFYGGVKDLANRIQANLNRTYPDQWAVVVSPEYSDAKELNVSVDTQKVWDALSILVNDFETYFTIKGRTITIGAAGVPAGHLFKYGKGNGLYEIEQTAETDQAIVTRLRAYGSTRNLPHRYYNSLTGADGQKLIPDNMAVKNLMLPEFPYTTQDPYIDSPNIAKIGIRDGSVVFDGSKKQEGLPEIYPSIEGMAAEQLKAAGVPCNSTGALDEIVSAEQIEDNGVGEVDGNETKPADGKNTFKVVLKDLGFDIWEHRTSDTPVISFTTGMLGSREFEIVGCKPIKDSAEKVTGYELELNRVYDDDIKLWFPYKDYNAKADDKFVLLYIEMPEVYIKAAAQRLLKAATAWLAKNDYSRSIYAPKVDEIFMARQHDQAMASGGKIKSLHDTLKEGMLLLFEDEDLNINASIFIDRLTIKEEGTVPTYEVVLKEEKTVGRLDKMQNQIDSLAAGKGQGGGGYNAAQIRSMIDAYGGTRFLSKLKDDRTPYQLASDMGFDVGDFLASVSGGRFGKDAVTGQTFLEVDRIFARVRAYFESLTVIEAATLAGKHYVTPGGSVKCTKVEEVKDELGSVTAYRCYFLSEQDGEKTETKIIAGDQAISEMFNAKTGTANKVSNHRYWRLVTGVSNEAYTDDSGNRYGYVELSATDCESGSDIPKEGDVIEQFGNRTDRTRQSAIVFSTVDSDSPSIKLFTGIGSGETNAEHYSLDGRDIISQGYDAVKGHAYMKCYGDTYIGAPDGSTYIKYDIDENKTKVKADIEITSTIGGKSIDQYFGEKATEATNKYKYLAESLEKAAQDSTYIKGGLMLSTMIALGYSEGEARHILSGMNGSYNAKLGGRTIASWYGGSMIDLFNPDGTRKTETQLTGQEATSLIRMDGSYYFSNGNIGGMPDGSGWLAGDNITWDVSGAITFGNGIKIDLGGGNNTTLGGISDSLSSVIGLVNTIGNHLIPTYLDGGVYKETTWAAITNGTHTLAAIKTKEGFFSDKFISAKGASDTAGGAGATQLRMLTDVGINDGTLSAGQALVYNGTKWVNQTVAPGLDETSLAAYLTNNNYAKQSDIPSLTGYATESWVTGNGYITSAALAPYLSKDDAAALYQPKGKYLTAHQDIYALTLQAGTFSAKTYNPKTGAVTVNIPTTTSHISEGANLYFTDARAVAALKTTTDTLQANIDKKLDTATFNTFKALFDSMFVKEADANSPEGYRIKAVFGLYSPYYISAKGVSPDGGGGGSAFGLYTEWAQTPSSTDALGAVLGKSLYTKQSEHTTAISGLASRVTALEGKNYLDALTLAQSGAGNAVTAVSLSADKKTLTVTKGSTFLTTTSASSTYLSKTDAASTYVAKEEGKGLSEKNFTTALLNKLNGIAEGANKYIHPSHTVRNIAAAAGLVLASVSVDAQGHVTDIGSKTLAAADIPPLAISKVSGLQNALNAKAAKSDFDTLKTWIESMFVKETDSNSPEGFRIKAKFGLYSPYYISAKGASDSSGSAGGVGYGRLDSWADYVKGNGYVLSADLGYDLHTRLLKVYTKDTIDGKLAGIYTKTEADGRYVTALGTNGNYLTWTKNGTVNNLTVPFASGAGKLTASTPTTLALTHRETSAYFGGGGNTVADKPTGVDAFGMLSLRTADGWQGQLLMASNTATGLYWRTAMTLNGGWRTVLDSVNYSTVLDSHYALKTSLTSHTGNTTVHITAAERTKWNKVVTDFAAITGSDTDNIINKWEEVVAFLDTYTEADTLAGLLGNKADKTQLADYVTLATAQTITGLKTFNGSMAMGVNHYIFGVNESAGSMLHFDGSRTVIGSSGATSTVATHLRSKTGHLTCGADNTASYNVLDTGNYSGTLDGRYVTLGTTQTITGAKTFNANIVLGTNYAITSASAASAKIIKTTGIAIHGGTDKAAEDDANLRFGSWYGIGWYPTISGQTVAQGTNAMWLNVRTGVLTVAGKFVKKGGTSTQFLKADGSVDGTTYLPKSVFDELFEKVTKDGVTTIRAKFGLWTNQFLSAKGQSSDSGGGSGFGLYTNWSATPYSTDALGAVLGKGLHDDLSKLTTRVTSLEGGSALSVTTTGSGDIVTAITKSGTVITATKGASLDHINNLGKLTAVSGTTTMTSGLRLYQAYNNGYPTPYGNLLRVGGIGSGELLCGWSGSTTPTNGRLYYRSKRDVASTEWSAWGTVAYLTDLTWANVTGKPTNFVTTDTAQTISGAKTFTSANANCITLRRSNTDGGAFIDYYALNSTTEYWRVGMASDKTFGFAWKDALTNAKVDSSGNIFATAFKKSGGTASQFLKADGSVDANTYLTTSAASSTYVKKAGDTMTGVLVINGGAADQPLRVRGIVGNSSYDGVLFLQYGMNKPLYLGNQGGYNISADGGQYSGNAATATNADLLDGYHKESFDGYRYTKIDASALDNNTWYPVVFKIPRAVQTRVRVEGGSAANASWNSRTDKLMAVFLDYTVQGSDWGWVAPQRVVNFIQLGAGATGSNCVAGLGQLTNNSWEYVMVRGGAVYNFYISHWVVPELKTSTFTNNSQSIAPTTTSPTAITRNNARITDNVASATKLQTERTLWGQSFNGTANVDGAMTINYTGETGILLKRTEAGSGAFIRFCNNNQTANYFRMGMYGAGYFGVGYNGTDAINISTANNVGIGTTSPAYKLDVNGIIKSNNEIRTTAANGFRIAYGNYGFFIRNDGNNTYFMMTNSGDANGSYNSLRPLYINDSTGRVMMGNGLTVNEATVTTLKIGSVTITYDSANGGLHISGGGLYSDSYISAKGPSTASGGASGYGLYTKWGNTPLATDALGAVLGKELYNNKLDKSAGVTALGTSGNYLTWTRNGTTNNLTVPYATTANKLIGNNDLTYGATGLQWFNISGTKGCVAKVNDTPTNGWWHILRFNHANTNGYYTDLAVPFNYDSLYWKCVKNGGLAHDSWIQLLDTNNYSGILDGRYYTESEVNTKLTNGSVTKVGTSTVGGTAKPIYLNAGTPTALSATVGAANRPVYLNAGTITAGTYTFGNASGNAPISNGTLNTNLNADLLDNLHSTGYVFLSDANHLANCHIAFGQATQVQATNSWNTNYLLLQDISTWANTSTATSQSAKFSGEIWTFRNSGAAETMRARVVAKVAKWGSGNDRNMTLATDNGEFVPCIITYNSKTWLAIRMTASFRGHVRLMGVMYGLKASPFTCIEDVASNSITVANTGAIGMGVSYSANKFTTARTINGTSFDGSANITTASWGTARNIGIVNSDGTGTAVVTSVNGAANVNLRLPATIKAALTGNATTATTLQTTRTLWGQDFNGGNNVSGNLTTVGNITGSGAMTISSTNGRLTLNGAATALGLKFANTDAKSVILNGTAFKPYDAADNALELGTDAARWKKVTACNMRLSSSTSGGGGDVYAELWRGTNASWKIVNTGGYLKFQNNYKTGVTTYFDCLTIDYNSGYLTAENEVRSKAANGFRIAYSNYGFILRNDGNSTYFLLTASGDPYGSFNSLRPFRLLNSSGDIYMGNGALVVKYNGNVGFGTTTPQYKLHVAGTAYASTGIFSDGYVSAKGQSTTSDERLKQILRPVYLNVKDIAAAPSVEFVWKKDGVKDVGSIAQYWEKLMPQLINVMPDGMKGLQYGKAALMGVIAVARKTESLEERCERLEERVRELENELLKTR